MSNLQKEKNEIIKTYSNEERQSGLFIDELSQERKDELKEKARDFLNSIDDTVRNTGSLDSMTNDIGNIGKSYLREATQQSLDNNILQRSLSFSDIDSKYSINMAKYRKTLMDLSVDKNLQSKSVFKRALYALPFSGFAHRKLKEFQDKVQSSKSYLESLEKTFHEEIQTLHNDNEALIQEKTNIYEHLKKGKEYNYLLEAIAEEAEEKKKVLLESAKHTGNEMHAQQAEMIETQLIVPTLQRQKNIMSLSLHKHASYRAINQLLAHNREIIKQTEQTMDTAMPALANTMVLLTAAEQSKRALKLITSSSQLTNELVGNLTNLMKESQDSLHKIQSGNHFDLQQLIKTTQEMEKLEEKNKVFQKEIASKTRKAIDELRPILLQNDISTEERQQEILAEGLAEAEKLMQNQEPHISTPVETYSSSNLDL